MATRKGFTLIETAAVLAIVSVLGAIAIPAYSRFLSRARASEAILNVERLYSSAVTYFYVPHTTSTGVALGVELPMTVAATPSYRQANSERYEGDPSDWSHPTWESLNFSMSYPHYYQYSFARILNQGEVALLQRLEAPSATPYGHVASAKPDSKSPKVTICHFPPGNPDNCHTLRVGETAVPAHLAHGDFVGECLPDCSGFDGEDDDDEDDDGDDGGGGWSPGPCEAGGPPWWVDGPFGGGAGFGGGGPFGSEMGGVEGPEGCESPVGNVIGFVVMATGNLDGDDEYSFIYRVGAISESLEIQGIPSFIRLNPLE